MEDNIDPGGPNELFEMTVDYALGDRIRTDSKMAAAMWSALANIEWFNPDGEIAPYSFREAGGMIAVIRGEGDE